MEFKKIDTLKKMEITVWISLFSYLWVFCYFQGGYFERESVLGPLLALTTVPTCIALGANTQSPAASLWSKLRGFPKLTEDDLLWVKVGQTQIGTMCGWVGVGVVCRVPTAQGNLGKWPQNISVKENTGNLTKTQGILCA